MRAILFAYHEMGYACMEELINAGFEIPLLFTHEDDPNENIWFRRPVELAERLKIPYLTPTSLHDENLREIVRSHNPDYIFSFYYRIIIPKDYLTIPKIAPLNLHGSLLPKYRGRAPANWVLINGERETGVTLHLMEEKPDVGPILAQRRVEILFEDDILSLYRKLIDAARTLMREIMPVLLSGNLEFKPQVGEPSYYGRRRPEDGLIDWSKDAISIYNLIRALTHPYPGAFSFLCGKKVYIWKANPTEFETTSHPGLIVSEDPFLVSTGRGLIELKRVQLEGQEESEGKDFARRLKLLGERFGV